MSFHAESFPLEEYKRLEPQRLEFLEDSQLYNLLMRRTKGSGEEVMRAAVFVHDIARQAIKGSYSVAFTDADLRPSGISMGFDLVDRYWKPLDRVVTYGKSAQSNTGIFVPYEDGLDDEFLTMSESQHSDLMMSR